jgi:hypothetical protein
VTLLPHSILGSSAPRQPARRRASRARTAADARAPAPRWPRWRPSTARSSPDTPKMCDASGTGSPGRPWPLSQTLPRHPSHMVTKAPRHLETPPRRPGSPKRRKVDHSWGDADGASASRGMQLAIVCRTLSNSSASARRARAVGTSASDGGRGAQPGHRLSSTPAAAWSMRLVGRRQCHLLSGRAYLER